MFIFFRIKKSILFPAVLRNALNRDFINTYQMVNFVKFYSPTNLCKPRLILYMQYCLHEQRQCLYKVIKPVHQHHRFPCCLLSVCGKVPTDVALGNRCNHTQMVHSCVQFHTLCCCLRLPRSDP